MVNKVILIGNVGADPEVRYLEGGVAVANLRLATTERYKNKNGENIDQTECKITDAEGKPLEAQRVYTVAVMDQTFPEDAIQSLTDTGISIQDLLTEAIQSRKTITPGKDGRFIIR